MISNHNKKWARYHIASAKALLADKNQVNADTLDILQKVRSGLKFVIDLLMTSEMKFEYKILVFAVDKALDITNDLLEKKKAKEKKSTTKKLKKK